MAESENMVYEINFDTGERPERVAAIGERGRRCVADEDTEYRNRTLVPARDAEK